MIREPRPAGGDMSVALAEVVKSYRPGSISVVALRGVSLTVAAGAFVVVRALGERQEHTAEHAGLHRCAGCRLRAAERRRSWRMNRPQTWTPKRGGASDRPDAEYSAQGSFAAHGAVNSLREAYVAVRVTDGASPVFLDAGRINLRNGVGSGYNSTDYFKTDAVLSSTNFDPGALPRIGWTWLRRRRSRSRRSDLDDSAGHRSYDRKYLCR